MSNPNIVESARHIRCLSGDQPHGQVVSLLSFPTAARMSEEDKDEIMEAEEEDEPDELEEEDAEEEIADDDSESQQSVSVRQTVIE